MSQKDYMLVMRAIENCEEREKITCESYITFCPEHQDRIEQNRDMFLFATYMVRMEIERLMKRSCTC